MKLILSVLVFCFAVNLTFGLLCWECNNALTNDECLETGSLNSCVEEEAICEDQIRHEDEGKVIIIEKRCKQKLACDTNVAQNLRPAYPIQCHVDSPTSTCRCCCSTDGCNRDLLACWEGYPPVEPTVNQECPNLPNTPENGNMQCQGNKLPGTTCDFQCHQDYYLVGQPRLTCLANLTWDYPEPECFIKQCFPETLELGNGTVRCTDGNNLRSRCKFECRRNFALIGNEYTDCIDAGARNPRTGVWSNPVPRCKSLICPRQGPLEHGGFSCTDRRKVGSVCTWQCQDEFEIFPTGFEQNICLNSGQWDKPFPCCTLPCLPFALVDLVVILDSSSSVGLSNWILMIDFISMLFENLAMQPDAAQFAVFRYNRIVDTDTQLESGYHVSIKVMNRTSKHLANNNFQAHAEMHLRVFDTDQTDIVFGDFRDNRDAFLEKFREIQYDGRGTNTGNALTHAAENIIPFNNRESAGDVVLLITDGVSQDDTAFPARRLRNTGAEVLVVPVRPPTGDELDLRPFFIIADNPDNVFTEAAELGFEALNTAFAAVLAERLCPAPCSNPFHNHDEFPDRLRPYLDRARDE